MSLRTPTDAKTDDKTVNIGASPTLPHPPPKIPPEKEPPDRKWLDFSLAKIWIANEVLSCKIFTHTCFINK